MDTPSHESPTQELSWFSVIESHSRRRDTSAGSPAAGEPSRKGDVVGPDDVSRRVGGPVPHRRPTRFQLRGH